MHDVKSGKRREIDTQPPRKYRDWRNAERKKLNPPEFKIDATPQPQGIFARIRLLDQSLTFFLAVLILIIFVVFPLAGLGWLGKFIVDLVISILLLSGAVTSSRSRTLTVLVVLLTIAGLVVHWTVVYVPKFRHPVLEPVLLFCC